MTPPLCPLTPPDPSCSVPLSQLLCARGLCPSIYLSVSLSPRRKSLFSRYFYISVYLPHSLCLSMSLPPLSPSPHFRLCLPLPFDVWSLVVSHSVCLCVSQFLCLSQAFLTRVFLGLQPPSSCFLLSLHGAGCGVVGGGRLISKHLGPSPFYSLRRAIDPLTLGFIRSRESLIRSGSYP